MEVKKVVGLMVAMFAVCSAPAISLSAEINDITSLGGYLQTVTGTDPGVGNINVDIEIDSANSITSTVNNFILTTGGTGNPYSISPKAGEDPAGMITISDSGTLTIYGLNVLTNIAMGNSTTLNIGTQTDNRNFTIDSVSGNSNIVVDTAAEVTFNKALNGASLNVQAGSLLLNNGVNLSGAMDVSGGKLQTGNITAASLQLSGGEIAADGNMITLSGTNGANIIGGSLTAGTVSASKYSQSQASADVPTTVIINTLSTSGAVNISGGTLTVSNIGSAADGGIKPSSYLQTGGIVDVTNLYINGNVDINGGEFTLRSLANVTGNFTVDGATFTNNASAANFNIGGTYTQKNGATTIVGTGKAMSVNSFEVQDTTALQLNPNAKVIASDSFTVNGGTVKDSDVEGTLGSGTINAGAAYSQSDNSKVSVQNLLASYTTAVGVKTSGTVSVEGGTLKVSNLGNADDEIASYSQTGGDVVISNANVKGNMSVSGGTFKADGGSLSISGDYILNGATADIDSSTVQAANASISNNATLNLKNKGALNTVLTANADESKITIENSTVTTDNTMTQISAGKAYEQISSTVAVYTLAAGDGGVSLGKMNDASIDDGGTLNATVVDTSGDFEISGNYDDVTGKWGSEANVTTVKGASIILNGGKLTSSNLGTLTGSNAKRITSITLNNGEISTENVYSTGDISLGSTIAPANSVVNFQATGSVNTENGSLSIIKGTGDAAQTTASFGGEVSLGGTGSYIQSDASVIAEKGITAGGNITIDSGSKLESKGSLTAAGKYTQTGVGTTVDLKTPDDTTATNVISAKTFVLGDSTKLTTDSPIINLSDKTGISAETVTVTALSKIVGGAGTTSITINGETTGSKYAQGGDSAVSVTNLSVNGVIGSNPVSDVVIDSGKFTAVNIGSNSSSAAFQNITIGNGSSNPTVTVDNMYAWKGITLSSGTVTAEVIRALGNTSNEGGNITISGGVLNINSNLYANGKYIQQNGGVVNVADNAVLSAKTGFELGETSTNLISLGENARIETTGTSATSGSIVLTEGAIVSTGDGTSISAGYNYTQSSDGVGTTVSVDSISAGNNININKGTTTANSIVANNNGTYSQILTNSGTITVNTNNIEAYNVVIGGKTTSSGGEVSAADGGILNLGDGTNPSYLSAKNTIKISGTNEGTTLNFKNTTLKATTQSQGTSGSSVIIDGVKVNFSGDSNMGAYTNSSGVSQIINSISIGSDTSLNQTLLNIGAEDDTTAVLTVTAGDGGVNFGQNLAVSNYGILNLNSAAGDILFNTASKLTNAGTINFSTRDTDSIIYLSNINTASNSVGNLNNNGANIVFNQDAKVYTNSYNQTSGKTTFSGSATTEGYNLLNVAQDINITGGSLIFDGPAQVSALNNFNMAGGTSLIANATTNESTSINANTISIGQIGSSASTLTMGENSNLALKPVSTATLSNVTSTMAKGSSLTIDTSTSGSSALLNGSNFTLNDTASLNVNGNTTVNNTQITLASSDSKLNVNSSSGDVTFDANSKITNAGSLVISGDNNSVSINGSVNDANHLQGNITKTGTNTLNLNDKVYAGSLVVQNGTTNVNEDITLSGTVNIQGSKTNLETATVNVAEGKSITASGVVNVGSVDDYEYTHLILEDGSKLSGSSVALNAIIEMTRATIEASASDGNVTIGKQSNITVKKSDSGVVPTISTIKANVINILGGSIITIEEGARLVYDGTVINSTDAHYDVLQNATWQASNGTYTNTEYVGSGAILNNAGTVTLLGGTGSTPMNFTSSYASVNGGAVANTGSLTLYNNISFTDNKSAGEGGAIYNNGSIIAYRYPATDALAQNTKFHNNKAGFDNQGNVIVDQAKNGGAIYNGPDGTILLGDNSSFTSNVATGKGGALYNVNSSDSAVSIGDAANFEGNISYEDGGAVAIDAGTVSIGQNTVFKSNSAGIGIGSESYPAKVSSGGAVSVSEGAVFAIGKNASFEKNIATANGGAIMNAGTLSFDGSSANDSDYSVRFIGNKSGSTAVALKKGGAVYNSGTIVTKDESGNEINGFYRAQFGSSTVDDGNTAQYGGAIYNEIDADKTLVIKGSSFQNNKAEIAGGAIYNASGILDIQQGSTFEQNTSSSGMGGAIYNASGATLKLAEGLTFGGSEKGNKANQGGALYNEGTLIVNGTEKQTVKFVENAATSQGGALYNTSDDIGLQYSDFTKNTAGSVSENKAGQGGAIYNTASGFTLNNVNFTENTAQGKNGSNYAEGGAIYNAGTMSLNDKVNLSGNTALDNSGDLGAKGGAIYNKGTLNISSDTQLYSNVANGMGGAIYNAEGAVLTGSHVIIGGTSAEQAAGATPTMGNSADKGGGIYNEGSLSLEVASFIGNTASSAGGGLYYISNSSLNTKDLSFYANKVETGSEDTVGYGGAFYNEKNTDEAIDSNLVIVQEATFDSNSADVGSAIYNTGNMLLGVNNFTNNKIGSAVGNEGILDLTPNYYFSDVTGENNAGFLWNQKEGIINLSVKDDDDVVGNIFINNTGYVNENKRGAVSGAALHLTDDSTINTTVNGVKYENSLYRAYLRNNEGYQGGAIYKDSSVNLTLNDVVFNANTAYDGSESDSNNANGGAIYNAGKDGNKSYIIINDNVSFTSNISSGKGGAIYNGKGGIISLAAGYILGENTSGYSNIAVGGGGGIANEGNLILNSLNGERSAYFTYQGGGSTLHGQSIYNGDGGALYLGADGSVTSRVISDASSIIEMPDTIYNSVFTHNESMNGGAIYSLANIDIVESQFSGNRGYKNGGAIYAQGATNIVLDASNANIFTGNQAGNTMSSIASSGKGGAIYYDRSGDTLYTMSISSVSADGTPQDIFVGNSAIGAEGSGGAIYNCSKMIIGSNTRFYKNTATAYGGAITIDGGSLTLDLSSGDIEFDQNSAAVGSAIYMTGESGNGSTLIITGSNDYQVTFKDADAATGTIAQTIASNSASPHAFQVEGGRVNLLSDASGYHGAYYQTGGIVTVANKFLDVSDAPIKAVTGGTLIFENGAQLVSDELMISNNELNSSDTAKVVFNKNDKSKLSDLSALYDVASTNNYFMYGSEENGYHKIILKAADVEINDTALIAEDATIGNVKNSYAVRNLKLSNGATIAKNITVVGANTATEAGATLTLAEGALGSEQAGVYLKEYNANLVIDNTATPITLGGTIKNDGVAYNSSITKSGDGLVVVSGDASGYNGKYSQSAGTVQFTSGSKFFGGETSFIDSEGNPSITGGKLQVDDGTVFSAETTIKLGDDAAFSTSMPSDVDLTGESGALLSMGDPKLTVEFSPNSTLEVTSNSKVNAQKDEIKIGNENLQVNSVILGGASQNGGSVDVTVNPNTVFILQNERAQSDPSQVGKGGVLGFGSNVNFNDVSGNTVVPTVQLNDYTQLKFTNEDDSVIGVNIQSLGATAWADANGDIVKENKGKMTIDGNVDNFYGSLIVKNGEIATNGQLFNGDVKFDLSQIDDNAVAVVKNVTNSNDLYIVGDVGAADSAKTFNLTINNDRGNIELRQDANSSYNNMYVRNGSVANLSSASAVNVNDLVIKNSTVNLLAGNMNVFGNMSMGSTYNMMNGTINTLNIANNLTLTDNSDFLIDINPLLFQSDKVVINGNLQSDSTETRAVNISDWQLLSDPIASASIYNVFDVKGSVDNVVFTTSKNFLFTPIANYMFTSLGNGSYMLARTGYTSASMAVPVAMQVGGYLNQLASYDMAFGNLDTVMTLPVVGYNNQYAAAGMDDTVVYSPLFIPELEKGLWFRPYGNFEKVNLKDGPNVSNQSYGAFVGGDTPLTEIGHGFQGTLSAYIGYTGSHQNFEGVSNYQNGGTIGVTGAVYKGGFFSGLTVNVNASGNDSSTPYGGTDFFMLGAGVASKTGYNWELARGKFVIQPSWLMSYSYINAFSPGDLAGYKIDADGLHGVQLAPQIKLIANLPYGWQPYALFNFRWNLADETNVTINSIDIPDVSVKPYVEYGLGVQKRWGDRFTGFGQFLGRGAGRNGVGLNFGFRWTVGSGR